MRRALAWTAAGLAVYWLLVATEGTYLGTRAVVGLYDLAARHYDGIKRLRFVDEVRYLGLPLVAALRDVPQPRVLDVAVGTGRLPLALVRGTDFAGCIVGIDRSRRMLVQAARLTADEPRVAYVRQDAVALGFGDASFDAVTCIEAMEFMPRPEPVLREMARVLKPGGVLLISNRVGIEARLFPARIAGRGTLENALRNVGLEVSASQRWQQHYDLVWAYKPGNNDGRKGARS